MVNVSQSVRILCAKALIPVDLFEKLHKMLKYPGTGITSYCEFIAVWIETLEKHLERIELCVLLLSPGKFLFLDTFGCCCRTVF